MIRVRETAPFFMFQKKIEQNDSGDIGRDAEYLVQVGADSVDLAHVANAEGGQCAENAEENGEDRANSRAASL